MKYGSFEQAVVHQEVRSRCNNAIGDVEPIVSATLQFRKRKSSAAKSLASEEGPWHDNFTLYIVLTPGCVMERDGVRSYPLCTGPLPPVDLLSQIARRSEYLSLAERAAVLGRTLVSSEQ